MNKLQIIIDGEIYTSEQSTNLVTTLYIDYYGICFPDNQWADFSSVLNMWSCTLLEHSGKSEANFALYFMDGPFRLDVIKDKDMKLTIQCVNCRKDEVVETTISCDYVDLLSAVYHALQKFAKMLHEKDMSQGKYKLAYEQAITTMKALKNLIDKY